MSGEAWDNATPAEQFKHARRTKATLADPLKEDRLPPHSIEAEQGVLGCILLEPALFSKVEERFGANDEVFYDLRHRLVFQTMRAVLVKGALDLITLQQVLKDRQQLEGVGGLAYLASLPDAVPSAANLEYYLAIVREKYLARLIVQQNTEMVGQVMALGGVTEPVLARLERHREAFEIELHRGAVTPRYIKAAGDFAEEVWATFFGAQSNEIPGYTLPIEFKLKIRPKEVTLVTGDDGCGKSTFLNYCCIHLAHQMPEGEKVMVASFEEPPEAQIWGLTVQLCGTREFPDSNAGQAKFRASMSWLHKRILFYAFMGIADWRDVLDSFRYAAKNLGVKVFVLDSVMRIGIQDDDYAAQGLVAALFGQFAIEYGVHVFLVIHENKGADKGKAKVRGSKLWTANASNVVKIERNMEKGEKLDDIKAEYDELMALPPGKGSAGDQKKLEENRQYWREKWDSHAILLKQRRKGTQQNASKFFWYDWRNFQFKEHRHEQPVDWLARWAKEKAAAQVTTTDGHE